MIHSSSIIVFFFFSSRRRHTRCSRDWSSDVCSSDLAVRSFRPGVQCRKIESFCRFPGYTTIAVELVQSVESGRTRVLNNAGLFPVIVTPKFSVVPPDEHVAHQEPVRSEEHTSELQSRLHLVCRLLLEKKKNTRTALSTQY